MSNTCRIQNPNIPRAGRGGAARTAERRGEQSRAERDADGSVRPGKNRPSDPLANQRQTLWTSLRKHERIQSDVNRWRNKARGRPAVDNRFISGTRSALCSWLLAGVPTPICLLKPFSCKACPGNIIYLCKLFEERYGRLTICRIPNPKSEHTTGESGRDIAQYGGQVWQGSTGRRSRSSDRSSRCKIGLKI